MQKRQQKGFTTIEIILVVIIVAALAALSAGALAKQKDYAQMEKEVLSLKSYIRDCATYANKYGTPVAISGTQQMLSATKLDGSALPGIEKWVNESYNLNQVNLFSASTKNGTNQVPESFLKQDGTLNVTDARTPFGAQYILVIPPGNMAAYAVEPGNIVVQNGQLNVAVSNRHPNPIISIDKGQLGGYLEIKGGGDSKVYIRTGAIGGNKTQYKPRSF